MKETRNQEIKRRKRSFGAFLMVLFLLIYEVPVEASTMSFDAFKKDYTEITGRGEKYYLNAGDVISHQWDIAASKDTSLYSSSTQPMELRISGSLELQSGGQSVDIMGMLRDNPLFVRELSRLLVSQLSNAQNGGRGNTNLSFGGV